jgi:cytochrome c oxidase cbb3-type subunit III
MAAKPRIDSVTGVETTGHSWDGIEELNMPLPRWWLWTFYATVVFAIGYVVAYPALPGLNGATRGMLGWSSRGDIRVEMQKLEEARAGMRTKIAATPIQQVIADPDMRAFAVSSGAAFFKVNCVQCHGSGAQGSKGFPNLNDDSWLFGGTVEQIQQTIAHGVRATEDDATRLPPDMPKFGVENLLTSQQIDEVTEHILKLSGQEFVEALATEGAKVYADNCASCHGDVGQGNQEQGVPQLNDAIWLRGGNRDEIRAQINSPKLGMMPAWNARLGEAATKELAVYVHSLGGGQ